MDPKENQSSQNEKGAIRQTAEEAAKSAAEKGAKAGLKKAGKWAATKLGIGAAKAGAEVAAEGAIVGAEATAAATGVGVIAAVAVEVGRRILGFVKNIASGFLRAITGEKDTRKQVMMIAGGAMLAFLALGMPIPAAFAGLTALGAGASALGGRAIGGGISGFAQSAIYGITGVALPAIGIPILVALVTIPLAVALILFIINSGAYIVPPRPLATIQENPYIGVVKEASPSGPFNNSDLPITITYTITITARRGSLTNITFAHECQVLTEGGNNICPSPLPATTPAIISPTEPYVYSYTETYQGNNYRDSLVINTFSVTASTDEVANTTASGAASVIIGNPPTGCLVFEGNWNSSYLADIQAAAAYLTSNYPRFMSLVCSGGPLGVRYNPGGSSYWGFYHGSYVEFYSRSFTSRSGIVDTIYILAHELGHALANRVNQIYQAYEATPGIFTEVPRCVYSYPASSHDERFADAIGIYASNICTNLQSDYPIHYQFVKDNIF